jgi:inosose dehydratase
MPELSRRDFLKSGSIGTVGIAIGATSSAPLLSQPLNEHEPPQIALGLASYTFRKFSLDETLAMTTRVGLTKIAFKSFHLPLESSESEIKTVIEKTKSAGLDPYGCGVIYMQNEDEISRAFNYARAAGMRLIIGVPRPELLKSVNQKVQEYNIGLAIHNHGPGDENYPSPTSVVEKINGLDPRIGLCLDIGHTQRLSLDPSAEAKHYAARLLDVHIKDVTDSTANGTSVEIGRGVIDIPKFLKTLLKIRYRGVVSFEYEKDENDPLAGLAESVGYINGVLDAI